MSNPDVIVIGSGFGGSVPAARLAEAGFKVIVLERGPWRDTVPVRSMGIDKRAPLPRGAQLFTKLLRGVGGNRVPGNRIALSKHGLFELFLGKGATIACSSGVGGGSHVYSAVNIRPLAPNFWEGHAPGISDGAMSEHYDAVLERMGSTTPMADHRIPNTSAVRWKGSDAIEPALPPPDPRIGYLLPDDPDKPQKVVDEFGIERWEVDYKANEDGFLGSPTGSKATLDAVYLGPAMKRAGLIVRDMAEVVRIMRQGDGARYRVEFVDHHTGDRTSLTANHVIVAAGTINTLRILLKSRADGGLAGMPQLGKRFGTNGDYFAYWDYNDPNVEQSVGLPTTGGVRLKGDMESPMIGGGGLPAVDKYPLPRFIRNRMKKAYMIAGLGEDKLCGEVTLVKGKLKIEYDPDQSPIFAKLKGIFAEISKRTGHKIYGPKTPITVHPIGGACLGESAATGVIDANGEVFDNPGLYVTDGSALPRSPGGPPSMTIGAWADHVAASFIARHRPQ
ncbi:MAG: GMC family oxidoreductase [Gammaproteobacteria bacterium]|nr:GMC family oxidoreductase [Gammaproteobacteria bacterium]